jgi:hypothetical protein
LAGASILLISVKPQVLLFWPVWLAWAPARRYFILAGTLLALIVALLVSLAFNPSVLAHYRGPVLDRPPDFWATPTIGYWLRVVFGMDKFWLQFVPVLFGLAWSAMYFWPRRQDFSWSATLPILGFASLITSAYTWTYDQIILVPAQIEIQPGWRKGWTPRHSLRSPGSPASFLLSAPAPKRRDIHLAGACPARFLPWAAGYSFLIVPAVHQSHQGTLPSRAAHVIRHLANLLW